MNSPHAPFLAWPGWPFFREALLWAAALLLLWLVIYGGADYLTGLRDKRVRIHLDAELDMPFVPAFILAYRSIDVLYPLAVFVLRSFAEIRALTLTLAVVSVLAGVGFLLLPAEPAYPPRDAGLWEPLFAWNRHLVLTYNMVPSLHVALSVVVVSAYARRCGIVGKMLLHGWLAAIVLSTLLTHHHHLLDVVTGLLLGWGAYFLIYRPWLRRASAEQGVPANPSEGPAPPA